MVSAHPTIDHSTYTAAPVPSPHDAIRRVERRRRRRAWAIVVSASAFSVIAAALVAISATIVVGAVVLASAHAVQRHALIAPALPKPSAALNLDPVAVVPVLPDSMPVVSGPAHGASPADHGWFASLPVVAASSDPLAGPRQAAPAPTTLVRRDLQGRLVAPDPNPAEAALRLISLDEGSRRAVRAAMDIRGQHLDHAIIINLPFLIVFQSAQGGGNTPLVAAAAGVSLYRSREFLAVDDLEALIAAQIPAAQRSHYNALLKDYWREYALQAARDRAERGQDPAPESLLIAEGKLKFLGEEIARAFERTLASGDLLHYWFSLHLGLTPDQAEPFRATIAAHFQEHGSDADSAAKRQLRDDLRRGLTRTQQRTLDRNMAGFLD